MRIFFSLYNLCSPGWQHEYRIQSVDFMLEIDLESIGSSHGFEGELIWAGLDWRGPDISSGLVNKHLINLGLGLRGPDI